MAEILRTNTAVRLRIDKFLNYEDGVTPILNLTVTNTVCEMFIIPNDGGAVTRTAITLTASGGNNDMVHVTDDISGTYDLKITQAQTNFLGRMELSFTDSDVHLPVFKTYLVISQSNYDAMFIESDTVLANLTEIAGHSIIGTGTQVADAFEGMFNVASPVLTAQSVNQTGDSYAEVVKIPHSDGKVTFNSTALGDIKAQADLSLDSATPAKPTVDSINERMVALDSLISASKIAASMDAMSDIDFSAKMKTSLNASTPISVGKITGNVDGSVDSVTKAVTITSNADITSILADTNEIQGLIANSKIASQVKGMDADVLTASALKADAVTEIVAGIKARTVDGSITGETLDKIILAFTAGKVVITANSFAFYNQSNVLLFTLPITTAGRIPVIA